MQEIKKVRYYTAAKLVDTVYFPEDQVFCENCKLMKDSPRKHCGVTSEIISIKGTIGYDCPLEFIERKEE